MAAFSVTSAEITQKINDLRDKNRSLSQQIQKMKDSKDALNSSWDGVAKKNFSSAVEADATQMNNFSKLIEQYCQTLETIISKYQTTEANNAEMIATRRY